MYFSVMMFDVLFNFCLLFILLAMLVYDYDDDDD